MSNLKLDRKTLVIGFLVVVAALFILPRLGDEDEDNQDNDTVQNEQQDDNEAETSSTDFDLGKLVTARSIDRDGCAVDTTSRFEPNDSIYVVAEGSDVEEGTVVFARLYHGDEAVEDAPEITASEDYTNTCINFVFEPASGSRFEDGSYEAEFIVNGNQVDSIQFDVR